MSPRSAVSGHEGPRHPHATKTGDGSETAAVAAVPMPVTFVELLVTFVNVCEPAAVSAPPPASPNDPDTLPVAVASTETATVYFWLPVMSGYNAALLCRRLPDEQVHGIDLELELTELTRERQQDHRRTLSARSRIIAPPSLRHLPDLIVLLHADHCVAAGTRSRPHGCCGTAPARPAHVSPGVLVGSRVSSVAQVTAP